MKHLFCCLLFLAGACVNAQADPFFHLVGDITALTVINDSSFIIDMSYEVDQSPFDFIADSITPGKRIFTDNNQEFTIDSVLSTSDYFAELSISSTRSYETLPGYRSVVFDTIAGGRIPLSATNSRGISDAFAALIHNYNILNSPLGGGSGEDVYIQNIEPFGAGEDGVFADRSFNIFLTNGDSMRFSVEDRGLLFSSGLGGFFANNQRITSVADPVATGDAANKSYVDDNEDHLVTFEYEVSDNDAYYADRGIYLELKNGAAFGTAVPDRGMAYSGAWNADNKRITAVADPTQGTDAVPRDWVILNDDNTLYSLTIVNDTILRVSSTDAASYDLPLPTSVGPQGAPGDNSVFTSKSDEIIISDSQTGFFSNLVADLPGPGTYNAKYIIHWESSGTNLDVSFNTNSCVTGVGYTTLTGAATGITLPWNSVRRTSPRIINENTLVIEGTINYNCAGNPVSSDLISLLFNCENDTGNIKILAGSHLIYTRISDLTP